MYRRNSILMFDSALKEVTVEIYLEYIGILNIFNIFDVISTSVDYDFREVLRPFSTNSQT